MTQFATLDDLAAHLGDDLSSWTGPQVAQADSMLAAASGRIQSYCRQHLERVEADAIVLRPLAATREFELPELPVNAVAVLSIDNLPVTGYEVTRWGRIRWRVGNLANARYLDASWSPVVSVTYDHGYALTQADLPSPNPLGVKVLPDAIRDICVALAARGVAGAGNTVASESIGAYSVTYMQDRGRLELTPDERQALWRFRRSTASLGPAPLTVSQAGDIGL